MTGPIELRCGEAGTLKGLTGHRRLQCRSGMFWITWKGGMDRILKAQEDLILPRGSRGVVIQALGTGENRLLVRKGARNRKMVDIHYAGRERNSFSAGA